MSEVPGVIPFKGDPNQRFEFVKHIGTGTYGDVILCKDHDHENKLVIVKLTNFEDKTTRNEIMMLSKIQYKYIVQFYEYFMLEIDEAIISKYQLVKFSKEEKTSAFGLVIEFGYGGEFLSYFKKRSSIEEIILVKATSQISQALEYLNENHTMHRDIKPDNFLLDRYGNFKITDFGTCDRISSEESYRENTQQTGTAFYIAPEIRTNRRYYNYLIDIYSLGISIYRACCCKVSDDNLNKATSDKPIILPEPIPDHYSTELQELIQNMIAYHPIDRITIPEIKESIHKIITPKELSEEEQNLLNNSIKLLYGKDGHFDKQVAIKYLTKIDENTRSECPEASFQLAKCYLTGNSVDKDEEKAITHLRHACRKLYAPALKLLSFCYQYGIGVEKDLFSSIQLLTIAEETDAEASTILGTIYYNSPSISLNENIDHKTTARQDYELAFHYFSKAQKCPIAQNYLGLCYLNGYGVHKDINEAYKFFSLSAKGGSIDAKYNLANFYINQYPKDPFYTEKAVDLLKESARKHHIKSLHKLSELYSNGEIVQKDEKKAAMYSKMNSKSSDSQELIYDYALFKLNNQEEDDEIKENSIEAFELFRILSDKHPGAMHQLAKCYRDGIGTNKDLTKAYELFAKASEAGVLEGSCELALCYLNGQGCSEDKAKAIQILTETSQIGCPYSTYQLAQCYITCNGVEGPFDRGVSLLRSAHEGGCTDATNLLADITRGIPQGGSIDQVSKVYKESRELFEEAALKGNANACYNYGMIFAKGEFVFIDKLKSFSFFEKAAKQNHLQAMTELGKIYESGFGAEQDIKKAFQLYTKASNLGDPVAQYHLAMCYLNGKGTDVDKEKSRCLLEKASFNEIAEAKYELGLMYQKGIAGPVDVEKAAKLFEEASKQNVFDAKVQLGFCYLNGIGKNVDHKIAFKLFQEVGEKSKKYSVEAAFQLAIFYLDGLVVRADHKKAFEIFKKLCEVDNYVPAMCELGVCYIEGYGIQENVELGLNYLERAAEKGNAKAMNLLGVCYLKGKSKTDTSEGIEADHYRAFEYFSRAAEAGYILGKVNLATCYIQGNGVPINSEKGVQILKEAQENKAAKFRIGICLYKGAGVSCRKEEGLKLLEEASNLKDLNAMCYFGKLLIKGSKELKKDTKRAKELFEEAARQHHPESMFQLGLILESEDSEPENPVSMNKIKSQNLFQKSSDAGCSKATFHLGEILFKNETTKAQGVELFKKAAELDYIDALEKLAVIYEEGDGVDRNYDLASDYQTRASELKGEAPIDMMASTFAPGIQKKKAKKGKNGKKEKKEKGSFFGVFRTLRFT